MTARRNIKGKKTKEEEVLEQDLLGTVEIDDKYLGKCSSFYYEYDECVRDTFGELAHCKKFMQALKKCEEAEGLYNDVLDALNIKPKKEAFRRFTYY